MASRKIADLSPRMQVLFLKFSQQMRVAGLYFTVTCTARTLAEQQALYAQGRKDLKEVNELRKQAGLPPITENENRKKVTWTLSSKHIVHSPGAEARAFDIVLIDQTKGRVHWDLKADVNEDQIPDYEQAGLIGEAVGLKWGGRFNDYCHFEEV